MPAVADIGYMPILGSTWPTSTVGQRSIYCETASGGEHKWLRGNYTSSFAVGPFSDARTRSPGDNNTSWLSSPLCAGLERKPTYECL